MPQLNVKAILHHTTHHKYSNVFEFQDGLITHFRLVQAHHK